MLLVNARAGRSAIHGTGLIARQFIPAGTLIWRFQPGFDVEIGEEVYALLSPTTQEQVQYYACFDPDTRRFFLSSDDDRFMNHAESPNTGSHGDYCATYALVDIQPGEELTGDYREIGMLGFPDRMAA